MKQGQIAAGMTTEPTISRLLSTGEAKILVDMRSVAGTRKALAGPYPAACLYMETSWMAKHQEETQKLTNAFVKTLHYIHDYDHDAATTAEKMPKDYYAGSKDLYVRALATGGQMFTEDGVMPEDGLPTVLKVLSACNKGVNG